MIDPYSVEGLSKYAEMAEKAEDFPLAHHLYKYLASLVGPEPSLCHNIAASLDHEDPAQLDEAVEWLEAAMEGGGDVASTLAQLACVYANKREPEKAIEHAESALAIDPDCRAAKWNAALALLMKREWARGWEWYDEILGHKLRPAPRDFIQGEERTPIWDGEGGTVLISSEQGLGDEIMFASIVPDAIEAAETVILECEPRLVNLYRRSFPRATVTAHRKDGKLILPEPREITHTIPVGSLGRLFRLKDSDFPGTAYLKPDPERCVQWRALLDTLPGRKIGIMWRGGIKDTGEKKRSMTLETMLPILRLQGCSFVSLNHRGGAEEEIEQLHRDHGIRVHHWPRALNTIDYDDTAALVNELDCVVCVTSTIAHLCGALGKKAKVLVPRYPRWSYGLEGGKMLWYRSLDLRRQPQDDDWGSVVMRVAGELLGAG